MKRFLPSVGPASRDVLLVAAAILGLLAGGMFWWAGVAGLSVAAWSLATVPVLAALLVEIARSLRKGDVGLDLVAALSMSAALAFGEPLAANVVALMYAGGQVLETFAQGRARVEMTALLSRVAQSALRYEGGELREIPIQSIVPGDRLLIREGEVLPVDGTVGSGVALLDLSALTGESQPEPVLAGHEALSGSTCSGQPFDLVATQPAAESTYARITKLVAAAHERKAPMTRLADRYALGFLAFTVVLAVLAWILAGDSGRAVAVLVVATPCPLILAVPVALISGISRAAHAGVLVKDGAALEAMARVTTAIFDKTGTLTRAEITVREIRTLGEFREDDVLRLAASLELASRHVVAAALIGEAARRRLHLSPPLGVDETPGIGMEGVVDNHRVAAGGAAFVAARGVMAPALSPGNDVGMSVTVLVDGELAGVIALADTVRSDAAESLKKFREAGIGKIILASGDRKNIAAAVGRELGVDDAVGELTAAQKVELVVREATRAPVMMIGDGVNDAPALAAADVGVALGARGTAASTEAASVVVLVDALAPIATAIAVAHRTRKIALQSVFSGLGLSIAAMGVAALGYLPPVPGALLQEAIDVAVILNALRALR